MTLTAGPLTAAEPSSSGAKLVISSLRDITDGITNGCLQVVPGTPPQLIHSAIGIREFVIRLFEQAAPKLFRVHTHDPARTLGDFDHFLRKRRDGSFVCRIANIVGLSGTSSLHRFQHAVHDILHMCKRTNHGTVAVDSNRLASQRLLDESWQDETSAGRLARPRNVKRSDNYNMEPVNAVQVGEGHFTSELANGVLEPNADFRGDYLSITF